VRRTALVLALMGVSLLGMGTRIFRGSGGSSGATIVAAFTATPLQGATCVAPCVVHFDGSSSDSTSYSRDFHELKFAWGLGNPAADSQTWWHTAETGITRNKDFGPIVGHVYEAAGTYTATLTVTDPAGNTASTTQSVIVADPSTLTTYCVSNTSTWTGCTGTHISSADFDFALAFAGATGNKRRVRFNGGETFVNSAITSLYDSTAPGLIDSYGTGRATVTLSGTNWFFQMHSGWQITGIDFNCGSTECGLFTRQVGASPTFTATPINHAGFYNITLTGPVAECATAFGSGSTVLNHDAWFVANTCEKNANSTTGTQFVLGIGDRNLFIGNTFHANNREVQQLIMRLLLTNSAVSHNESNSPGADSAGGTSFRGILQLRADSTGVEPVPNTRNEVAYNKFAVRNGPANGLDWTKICSHHSGCDATTAEGYECSDIIYENNLHTIDGTPGAGVDKGVVIQCSNTTVRNNVFDLQGQGSQTTPSSGPTLVQLKAKPTNVASEDRIEVYGNTLYITGEGNNFTGCEVGSNAGTNHRCAANLAYLPSHGGTITEKSGTWSSTPANDFRTTPIPSWWPGTPPGQGLTDFLDFLATSGSCDITAASLTNAGAQYGCIVH